MPLEFLQVPSRRRTTVAVSLAVLLPVSGSLADTTERAGRYLDRSVLVHETAQLNPLEQVADLRFDSRVTVAGALRTALSGTGYRLLDPEAHPDARARSLLRGRIAIPHEAFDGKRLDSVLAAVAGAGRGFRLEVDHTGRRIRIVPLRRVAPPAETAPGQPVPDYRAGRVDSADPHPAHRGHWQ